MKKKLLFTLPSLNGGGAERVMSTVISNFDPISYDLHLALVRKEGIFLRDIPPYVNIYDLKAERVRKSILQFLKLAWKIKPHIIISTLSHLNMLLMVIRPILPKAKLIIRESSIVSVSLAERVNNPWLWRVMYKFFYKKADKIICQSQFMLNDLSDNFNINISKMVRIYNPLNIENINVFSNKGGNPFIKYGTGPHVVTAGRLTEEKGHERLIESFAKLVQLKSGSKLWILGCGPLKKRIYDKIEAHGLKESVKLVGFQDNPYRWFKYADLFVITSHFEGLPNALLEALACGCPVVALWHPGGTLEILELTGLSDRFVYDLDEWKDKWFERPSKYNINNLIKNFGSNNIIEEYVKVIEDLLK